MIGFLARLEELDTIGVRNEAGVAYSWSIACGVVPAFKQTHGAQARERMRRVAKRGFNEGWFLAWYAFMLEEDGELDSAYDVYKSVPRSSAYYADAQHGMGRVDERRVDFFAALRGPEAREKAIDLMRRALEHYERALEIDPNRERTVKAIERCRDTLRPGFFNPFGIRPGDARIQVPPLLPQAGARTDAFMPGGRTSMTAMGLGVSFVLGLVVIALVGVFTRDMAAVAFLLVPVAAFPVLTDVMRSRFMGGHLTTLFILTSARIAIFAVPLWYGAANNLIAAGAAVVLFFAAMAALGEPQAQSILR